MHGQHKPTARLDQVLLPALAALICAASAGPPGRGAAAARAVGPRASGQVRARRLPLLTARRASGPLLETPPPVRRDEPPPEQAEAGRLPVGAFVRHPRLPPPVDPRSPARAPQAGPAAAAGVAGAAGPIRLFKNIQVGPGAIGSATSSVLEPSAAIHDGVVFYTGNFFAAVSTDGGSQFEYIDVANLFPPAGNGDFCDQVVHYFPKINVFAWLILYHPDEAGHNVLRLCIATPTQAAANTWLTVDLVPDMFGFPDRWFDFPDLAVGQNALYLSSNIAGDFGFLDGGVVIRIPARGANGLDLGGIQYITDQYGEGGRTLRLAQNCSTRAYFAAHRSTSSVRVFSWDEGSPSAPWKDVSVGSWSDADYTSLTPDGANWLGRAWEGGTLGGRILTGTLAPSASPRGGHRSGELWFAWNAARGGSLQLPHPYVEIIRLDAASLALEDQPVLWNEQAAFAYPALNTSAGNEVGMSIAWGGGCCQVFHAVRILTASPAIESTAFSTDGPDGDQWGDYLAVRPYHPNPRLFAATGYTLFGGPGDGDVAPRFVIFGRPADGGDAYELDDVPADAKPIEGFGGSASQQRSIHYPGDVDWVKVHLGLPAVDPVTFKTTGNAGDTEMWLYGPGSTTALAAYDDNSGPGQFSFISTQFGGFPMGTYYLKIREKGNDAIIPAYTLAAAPF